MGERQVKLVGLKCHQADDGDRDELIMFHNGTRCWPDEGEFGISTDTSAELSITREFGDADSMRFSLRDDDSPFVSFRQQRMIFWNNHALLPKAYAVAFEVVSVSGRMSREYDTSTN